MYIKLVKVKNLQIFECRILQNKRQINALFVILKVVLRLDIAKVLEKGYFVYRGGIYMKVTYREDSKMNHYEMQLVVHPKKITSETV